jgi:hypothetical protein
MWIQNLNYAASEVGLKSDSTKPLIVSLRATVENSKCHRLAHTIPYR